MPDGKVIYEVRADDSKVESDLNKANSTVKKSSGKLAETSKKTAKAVGASVLAVGAASIKLGSDFEQSFAKASTLFGDVAVDSEGLQEKILDLSSSSGIAATELNEALYSALSAGVPITEDAEEAMSFLDGATKLAKAGFTDVDTAISATAKTLNAYGLDASEADRIQGLLIQTQNKGITTVGELGSVLSNVTPTAAAMGVEFEQVSAALANMTAQGTPTGAATTQLNGLLAELGKQGTKAQKALAEATEGTDLAGKSFQEMMADGVPLNEVLDLMTESAEANGMTILDMFGSIEAGKAALAISGKNSEAFADTLESMSDTAGVVDEAFETVSDTTEEKMARAMTQLQNIAIELFNAILPLIDVAMPVFLSLIKAAAPLFEILFTALGPIVEAVMPMLVSVLEMLIPMIGYLVENLLPLLVSWFNALSPVLEVLIGSILSVINTALKPVMAFLKAWVQSWIDAFDSISGNITDVIEGVKTMLNGLINFITGIFTGDWEKAFGGLADIFGGAFGSMKGLATMPLNFIVGKINKFIEGINEIEIPDWVPGVGGKGINIPLIPKLARGGLAFGPTTAIVGDNPGAATDPEVIAPLSKLQAMLNGMMNTSGSTTRNISIMITGNTISSDMDINTIGSKLTKKLQNEGVL